MKLRIVRISQRNVDDDNRRNKHSANTRVAYEYQLSELVMRSGHKVTRSLV